MFSVIICIENLIVILIFYSVTSIIAAPINNGLIVKFSPVFAKEEVKTKSFNLKALFAKIPQDCKYQAYSEILAHTADLGTGCSNQIAKILLPSRGSPDSNNFKSSEIPKFVSIPIMDQNFTDYTIIVATAPNNIRLTKGAEATPVVVYVVFPNDDPENLSMELPSIYFVTEVDGSPLNKIDKSDPVLIVDSNRTVTGLKSTEVVKFISFKNNLKNRYDYKAVP